MLCRWAVCVSLAAMASCHSDADVTPPADKAATVDKAVAPKGDSVAEKQPQSEQLATKTDASSEKDTANFNSISRREAVDYLHTLQEVKQPQDLIHFMPLPLWVYKGGQEIGPLNTYAEVETAADVPESLIAIIAKQKDEMGYDASGYYLGDGEMWFSKIYSKDHPKERKIHIVVLRSSDDKIAIRYFRRSESGR
jgi:hypothetical protein